MEWWWAHEVVVVNGVEVGEYRVVGAHQVVVGADGVVVGAGRVDVGAYGVVVQSLEGW